MSGVAATARIKMRAAVGVRVNEFAAFDDSDGCGWDAGLLEHIVRNLIDACLQGGIDGVDGLCVEALGYEGERTKNYE